MSSTSVHSGKKSNTYLVGGIEVPKEDKRIEMPPESAKRGPTILSVKQGEKAEIPVQVGRLDEKGTLRTTTGEVVAKYDEKVFKDAKRKEEEKAQRKNAGKEDRGADR